MSLKSFHIRTKSDCLVELTDTKSSFSGNYMEQDDSLKMEATTKNFNVKLFKKSAFLFDTPVSTLLYQDD